MQNTPGIRGRADIEVYGFRAGGFTALFAQAEAAGIASLFLRRETGFPARLGTRRPLDPVTRQHTFGARRRGNQHVESNLLLQIGIVVTGRQADREIGTLVKAGPGRSAFHGTDLRPYPGRGEEYKEDQNGFFIGRHDFEKRYASPTRGISFSQVKMFRARPSGHRYSR